MSNNATRFTLKRPTHAAPHIGPANPDAAWQSADGHDALRPVEKKIEAAARMPELPILVIDEEPGQVVVKPAAKIVLLDGADKLEAMVALKGETFGFLVRR